MSFEISTSPTGSPAALRRGVTTTRAWKRLPSLRSRSTTPSHFPSRSAAAAISSGLPAATSSGVWRIRAFATPTTSPGSYP
jgi:hypothetical protein